MLKCDDYRDKKVLVLGLAKSGYQAALLLHQLGALVTVNDHQPLDQNKDAQQLVAEGIRVIAGHHPLELLDEDFSVMVKNPGIPYQNPMVKKAQEKGLPIITEPELAYEVLSGTMIGITGTNGKTTTTTLITKILNAQQSQPRAFAAGNIGIPATLEAQTVQANQYLVTELSSFQLMGVTTLRPHIAVLTNIYEAHLDYHGDRSHYIAAKMNLVKNQTPDDYFVVNWDQDEWQQLSQQTQAQIVPFSRLNRTQTGAYLENGQLCFQGEAIMPVADLKLPGQHNIENALAAIAATKLAGVTNEAIIQVLTTFGGVRHRIQFVKEWQQRRIYNDSKATNIEAAKVAIASFDQPITLIAGGLDRGFTFEELVPELQQHVKNLVVYGETADLMLEAGKLAHVKTLKKVSNLVEATEQALALSQAHEIILLSPAAASWDQFKTFEERGDLFINTIERLTEEEPTCE